MHMAVRRISITRLGSSVGTSARLKIVRSTVRSRPQPLQVSLPAIRIYSCFFLDLSNISITCSSDLVAGEGFDFDNRLFISL